jgi:KaiC/GvpD/RAD55 family RecA-like ATPase
MPRHLLIAGTTGSGKTMTCLSMVYQAWKNFGIPFVVLETAEKAEYGRRLKALVGGELQVFSVADEKARPLHLDLLRVPEGISVEYHIGRLMQIFRAAFPMYPPAPQLLKEALYRLYEAAG